jgi:hypothetical protein
MTKYFKALPNDPGEIKTTLIEDCSFKQFSFK